MKNIYSFLFLVFSVVIAFEAFADVRAVTPDKWGNRPGAVQLKRHNLFKKKIAAGAADVVFILVHIFNGEFYSTLITIEVIVES